MYTSLSPGTTPKVGIYLHCRRHAPYLARNCTVILAWHQHRELKGMTRYVILAHSENSLGSSTYNSSCLRHRRARPFRCQSVSSVLSTAHRRLRPPPTSPTPQRHVPTTIIYLITVVSPTVVLPAPVVHIYQCDNGLVCHWRHQYRRKQYTRWGRD